ETWRRGTLGAASGKATLTGLWAEPGTVHMALAEPDGSMVVLSLPAPDGHFPSVGVTHAQALRPERVIRDLYGLVPDGAPDA
ncbi:hypothetical protein J8J27_33400, partial [Mycobacterium tuberculosis]|nr:hypothetical protein [Mycobacterium tuberculosis]